MKKILTFCVLAGCASMLNAACSDSYYQSQYPQGSSQYSQGYYEPGYSYDQGYQGSYGQGYQGQRDRRSQGFMNQDRDNRQYQGYQGYGDSQRYQGQYGSSQGYQGYGDSQRYQGFGAYGQGAQGYGETSDMGRNTRDMNRDDKSVESDVRDSLRGVFTDRFNNVNVQVRNGEVTLTGTVPTQEDKKDLEEKVRDMDGVRNVINRVMVKQSREETGQSNKNPTSTNRY